MEVSEVGSRRSLDEMDGAVGNDRARIIGGQTALHGRGNTRVERFYQREGWRLAGSFEDTLRVPEGCQEKFVVPTQRFLKNLAPAV